MAESGKSDRWNSLLETLGVPVSDTKPTEPPAQAAAEPATDKTQPISKLRPEKPKAAPKPKPARPAAKSPSYWSRIAGALGLEVAAPPEPAPPPPVAEQSPAEVPEPARRPTVEPQPVRRERDLPPRAFDRPPRQDRPPRPDRPAREEPSRREERRPAPESSRSPLEDMFGAASGDLDVFALGGGAEAPRMREPDFEEQRKEDESGSVLEYDRPEDATGDLSFEAPADREMSSRAEPGEEREGRRRRRRRRGRGRRGSGEAREPLAPRQEEDIEPAGEEADFDFDRDEELDLDLDVEQRPPASRRGRHHRAEEPVRGERPVRGEDRDRGPRRRQRHSGRPQETDDAPQLRSQPPLQSPVSDPDTDDLLADTDDVTADSGGDVPTHKKIPTWQEAVGILIDANMAARSADRDRGRGRGRR